MMPAQRLQRIGWQEFNWNILFLLTCTRTSAQASDAFPAGHPYRVGLTAAAGPHRNTSRRHRHCGNVTRNQLPYGREVRMVVASFFDQEHAREDWRIGDAWFLEHLAMPTEKPETTTGSG
jgi:hypothetical protein